MHITSALLSSTQFKYTEPEVLINYKTVEYVDGKFKKIEVFLLQLKNKSFWREL